MADLILTEQLQAHLVEEGIGQHPSAAADEDLPSIWLNPRAGAPEPRDGENATITLVATNQVPGRPLEGFLETRIVDVIVRARKSPLGELIQRQIRAELDDRREYFLNDLRIERSHLWRGLQPTGSDETSYQTNQSFLIEARTKSLAGLPYSP